MRSATLHYLASFYGGCRSLSRRVSRSVILRKIQRNLGKSEKKIEGTVSYQAQLVIKYHSFLP